MSEAKNEWTCKCGSLWTGIFSAPKVVKCCPSCGERRPAPAVEMSERERGILRFVNVGRKFSGFPPVDHPNMVTPEFQQECADYYDEAMKLSSEHPAPSAAGAMSVEELEEVLTRILSDHEARLPPESCPTCGSAYLDSRGNCGECLVRKGDANVAESSPQDAQPAPAAHLPVGILIEARQDKVHFDMSRAAPGAGDEG